MSVYQEQLLTVRPWWFNPSVCWLRFGTRGVLPPFAPAHVCGSPSLSAVSPLLATAKSSSSPSPASVCAAIVVGVSLHCLAPWRVCFTASTHCFTGSAGCFKRMVRCSGLRSGSHPGQRQLLGWVCGLLIPHRRMLHASPFLSQSWCSSQTTPLPLLLRATVRSLFAPSFVARAA